MDEGAFCMNPRLTHSVSGTCSCTADYIANVGVSGWAENAPVNIQNNSVIKNENLKNNI